AELAPDLVESVVGAVRAVVEERYGAGAHPLGQPDGVVDGGVAVVDRPWALVLEELRVVDEHVDPGDGRESALGHPELRRVVRHVSDRARPHANGVAEGAATLVGDLEGPRAE